MTSDVIRSTETMSKTTFGFLGDETLPLFTDLYELRMMQAYYNQNHNPRATFSLFVRDLPPDRGFMIAAGLEQAIHYVENVSFGDRSLEFLIEQGFDEDFLSYLADFEFTGEIRALPEGTLAFANEPLLEVTAPILQAQLFETAVINQIGYQSLVATKASRMRDVIDRWGGDQQLVDFGSRRAHGTDAGIKAARAAYIGGFDATSNVAAGEAFEIPVAGTMAHSWVQSFERERGSFETFVVENRSVVDILKRIRESRQRKCCPDCGAVVSIRGFRGEYRWECLDCDVLGIGYTSRSAALEGIQNRRE